MENKSSKFKKIIIVIALILLILFFVSQKRAGALVKKGQLDSLTGYDYTQSSNWYTGQGGDKWLFWGFDNAWTNTTDYNLIGIKFREYGWYMTAESYSGMQEIDQYNTNFYWYGHPVAGQPITSTLILWDSNGYGYHCYTTSEIEDIFFCPITKNVTYTGFAMMSWATAPGNGGIFLNVTPERVIGYYNFDTSELINSNMQIYNSTQQINDSLNNSNVSGASSSGLNDITSNASGLNTDLNSVVSTNNFVTIFTNFFTQIDNSTCSPITLPIPYTNETLVLPCLGSEFSNRIPILWTLYTTIITGLIVFRFWRFYIDMFKHLLDPYSTGLHGVSDIAGGGK